MKRTRTRASNKKKIHSVITVGDIKIATCHRISGLCIGPTERSVNDRGREYACALRSSPSGILAVRCDRCDCQPVFTRLNILSKSKARATRKLLEAHRIYVAEDTCMSTPAITLSKKQICYIPSIICDVLSSSC